MSSTKKLLVPSMHSLTLPEGDTGKYRVRNNDIAPIAKDQVISLLMQKAREVGLDLVVEVRETKGMDELQVGAVQDPRRMVMAEPGLYEMHPTQQRDVISRIDNLPMPVGYLEAFVTKLNGMGYTIARKVETD